jgi:hypothetical protein
MRYLVLLADSIAVAGAFVVLKDALSDADERFYSALGFAANMLAGATSQRQLSRRHWDKRLATAVSANWCCVCVVSLSSPPM